MKTGKNWCILSCTTAKVHLGNANLRNYVFKIIAYTNLTDFDNKPTIALKPKKKIEQKHTQ